MQVVGMAEQLQKSLETLSVSPSKTTPDLHYDICPFGDLLVVLPMEDRSAVFRVSSMTLRMVSPVWAKSLDPNSAFFKGADREHRVIGNESLPVLELFDDDATALLMVLRIIHHRIQETPLKATFTQLRAFTIVCDKYDCVESVIPSVYQWMDSWIKTALFEGCEDYLLIMCTFGVSTYFEHFTKSFIENIGFCTNIASGEREMLLEERLLSNPLIPEKVLNEILIQRKAVFSRTMEVLRRYGNKLRNAPSAIPGKPETYPPVGLFSNAAKVNSRLTCLEDCLSMAYGSFIRFLDRLKINDYVWDTSTVAIDTWPGILNKLFVELNRTMVGTLNSNQHYDFDCGLRYFESELRKEINAEKANIKGLDPANYVRFTRKGGSWSL